VAERTAIQWITGKLERTSKRYLAIKNDIHSENSVARRNDWLVRLPLPGTPSVSIDFSTEVLSANGYEDVCSRYGFSSLLEDNYYNEIARLFGFQEE